MTASAVDSGELRYIAKVAGASVAAPAAHCEIVAFNQSWNAPMWCSLGTSTPPSR